MILEQVVVLFPIVAYWTLKEGVHAYVVSFSMRSAKIDWGLCPSNRLNETPCLREERPPAHLLGE